MPLALNGVATSSALASSISAATVAVSSPILPSTTEGGQGYYITGNVVLQGNAAASTVVLKIVQGTSTGGTAVYTSPSITVAAGAVVSLSVTGIDTTQGGVSQYSIVVTPSAATQAVTGGVATISVESTALA